MIYQKAHSDQRTSILTTTPGIPYSYNSLSTHGNIFIRKVDNREDIIRVFDVRWKGYAKYFRSKEEMVDGYDLASNMTLLLAEDERRHPCGTLRILDRRFGDIELDEFLDVNSLLPENERLCIEASRFSIPPHPNAKLIKLLLWKALLLYCLGNGITTIVISIRPQSARLYRCLFFDDLGSSGIYCHSLLGNLEHHSYKHNIAEKRPVLKAKSPFLYNFLYEEYHPNIHNNCFMPIMPKSTVYAYNYSQLNLNPT